MAKGQGGKCRDGEGQGGKHTPGQRPGGWRLVAWPGSQRAKNAKPAKPFVLRTYIVGEQGVRRRK